ncbi:MAG: flagellar basal body P-ring formation protein FlgA [Anaerolineae bacterium]|nr:flagellar basal body P-ring formation protein FlgA [Phycisphaerae bacterium]
MQTTEWFMYNGNGRPLSRKKTAQLFVILVLAWATQTLLHQWGFGQTVNPNEAVAEKFVPGSARFASGATIEIRSEATIVGAEVKLKQVCRWSDADASIFAPIADLVLVRLGPSVPFRAVTVNEIKTILRDAGVNIATVNFVGAGSCTIGRSDVQFNEGEALQKWIDAHDTKTEIAETPTTQPATAASAIAGLEPSRGAVSQPEKVPATQPTVAQNENRTLRDLLTNDLAVRLGLPVETLQMSFNPQDERLLALSDPLFKFQIDPQRARDLGEVSWHVRVFADGTNQKATISATARAWQSQVVVTKPLSFKQVIRDSDVVDRRTLIDHMTDDTVLDRSQVVGQQASRDLKPGVIVTGRLIDAVQLVRPGQFVTVVYRQGVIELKSVARALDGGAYGQTIRVKNESTKDIFEVILTGPQTASMSSAPTHSAAAAVAESR